MQAPKTCILCIFMHDCIRVNVWHEYMSQHTCVHLNVCVSTVYRCVWVCLTVLSSLEVTAVAEGALNAKIPSRHLSVNQTFSGGSMCVLVYLCFCQSAVLTARPSVRPSIHRSHISILTVITRADKVSWSSSLYSLGCKQRDSFYTWNPLVDWVLLER